MYRTQGLKNSRIEVADALRGIAVLQIVVLYQWSKKHQRGPLETLWRKLTWL